MTNQVFSSLALSLLVVVLSGCGGKGEVPTASQVAARVGSHEITIHQVNAELAHLGNAAADQAKQAGSAVLERLIDQELLVGEAEEQKIDRDPAVMAAVSAARRGIVARAYLDRVTAQIPRPDAGEVRSFYNDNPELFSKRRIYALRQLHITVPPGRDAAVRAVVDKASNLNEVATWLRNEKLDFSTDGGVKPAEDLPLDALKQLSRMHDGQIGVLASPGSMLVVELAGVREQPIDEASATPLIESYLTNRSKENLAHEELRRLRERTGIEYVGEFNPKAVKGDAAIPEKASGLSAAVLEKGIGGLK